MTRIINFTPFANLRFSNLDAQGNEFGVFMVKTAHDIPAEGPCTLSSEQEPFVLTDSYFGELNTSPLRYPSDMVPWKPATDVILDAIAYAPSGQPSAEWQVGIRIRDAQGMELEKRLRVTGPREWSGQSGRRQISAPRPVPDLPIRYDLAHGGILSDGEDKDGQPIMRACETNPVGCGWLDRAPKRDERNHAAPQISGVDGSLPDPAREVPPEGFGPIPPAWLPRRSYAGTYDDHWLNEVWPGWPHDYAFRFHNAAHPDLQSAGHMRGALSIELTHLHPDRPVWRFSLPDERPVVVALCEHGGTTLIELQRDTVFLDIGEDAGTDPRVFCVWRTPFDPLNTESLTVMIRSGAECDELYGAGQLLRLTPADCACDPALLDPDVPENPEETTA